MPLALNHIKILDDLAPGLTKYIDLKYQSEPILLITHVFSNSQLYRSRTISPGFTLSEINGITVKTLKEFRKALNESLHTGYFTIKAFDNVTCASHTILVVLPINTILEEEITISEQYHYSLSTIVQDLQKLRKEIKK